MRAQVSKAALALFAFGQAEAAKRGLLLVDTKYEFGKVCVRVCVCAPACQRVSVSVCPDTCAHEAARRAAGSLASCRFRRRTVLCALLAAASRIGGSCLQAPH